MAARQLLSLAATHANKKRDRDYQIFILATKNPRKPDFAPQYFPGSSFATVNGVSRVLEPAARIVVVRPDYAEYNEDGFNEFYERIFWRSEKQHRYGTVYTDEMNSVTGGRANGGPPFLKLIYTQGAGLGLGAWAGNQDAVFLQRELLSQAEHILVFQMKTPSDRKMLSGAIGFDLPATYPDKHGFYYDSPEGIRYYSSIQSATRKPLID